MATIFLVYVHKINSNLNSNGSFEFLTSHNVGLGLKFIFLWQIVTNITAPLFICYTIHTLWRHHLALWVLLNWYCWGLYSILFGGLQNNFHATNQLMTSTIFLNMKTKIQQRRVITVHPSYPEDHQWLQNTHETSMKYKAIYCDPIELGQTKTPV